MARRQLPERTWGFQVCFRGWGVLGVLGLWGFRVLGSWGLGLLGLKVLGSWGLGLLGLRAYVGYDVSLGSRSLGLGMEYRRAFHGSAPLPV